MKTVLQYGLLMGFLLLLANYILLGPLSNVFINYSLGGALRFIVVAGVLLYGINAFLIKENDKQIYYYGIGVLICVAMSIIGLFVFSAGSILLLSGAHGFDSVYSAILSRFLSEIKMGLLLSFLLPLTYISGKKKEGPIEEDDDVLDSGYDRGAERL